MKWSRTLPSTPSTVTVVEDSAGRYFASFVVETGPDEVLPETTPELGIDLGLGHFAVLSDGRKVDSPRFLRRAEKRLKKARRALSRTEKGSRNRDKARVRVARAHARVADARREFHHRLSTRLIRENQAVAVEDLAVKGLARTRLAKSVHDAGWSAFVSMLEYKAARYGRTFIRIGRFEPTSQVCSRCGVKDGPKPLHVRVWTCGGCGAVLDRDINAAVNVAKAAGLAVTACGARKTGTRPGTAQRSRNPLDTAAFNDAVGRESPLSGGEDVNTSSSARRGSYGTRRARTAPRRRCSTSCCGGANSSARQSQPRRDRLSGRPRRVQSSSLTMSSITPWFVNRVSQVANRGPNAHMAALPMAASSSSSGGARPKFRSSHIRYS
ncbi:transposase [Streptomyces rapamycinicus NRRL 5491]|uniref:Transposase n=1 Tax=Streptomyces rapamycinicus (strain ATCC 29253 / DSM 41530 / NRRL 5491 / AYB-994) TaxID=1343740 RepID=A0A3L8R7Z5_STRRN|nr:transposase [Streptomyces rapamycinicus NRRL 5491]